MTQAIIYIEDSVKNEWTHSGENVIAIVGDTVYFFGTGT